MMIKVQTEQIHSDRRSILPLKYAMSINKKSKNMKVEFSPLPPHSIPVDSYRNMGSEQVQSIWWRKSDYDDFSKTTRIITKALLEGGSEIWLKQSKFCSPASNKASSPKTVARQTTSPTFSDSLKERKAALDSGDHSVIQDHSDIRDTWWHRFGHSRRGLEHVSSLSEGQQRQATAKDAIQSVIKEQNRQRLLRKSDPDRIRTIYHEAASAARELSYAAGASDANAVRENFDDSRRKTREFFLQRKTYNNAQQRLRLQNQTSWDSLESTSPTHSSGVIEIDVVPTNGALFDANTSSQLRFQRYLELEEGKILHSAKTSSDGDILPKLVPEDDTVSSTDSCADSLTAMSTIAAGFSAHQERTDMAAVLTGMGAIPLH